MNKLLSIFIIAIFGLIAVKPAFAISPVSGYFSDKEISTGNILSAATLDFSLRNTSDVVLSSPLFNITGMLPGNNETKTIRVKKDGALDFKYNIGFSKTAGDDILCNALQVEAKLDGTTVYNGNLSTLNISLIPTITAGQDDWEIIISLTDSSSGLKNKTCSFNLTYMGWQTDSDGTWGFTDEETLSNTISTGTWITSGDVVINEIMWMGSNTSSADEWIELRNNTAGAIDLTGWKIENAGAAGASITLSGTIPASGYFLLANYTPAASAINNSITADQGTTEMSLLDGGEQLTLKTGSGTTIDQTPIGSWAAGSEGADKKSMERNDDPTTGWHTCIAAGCHTTTYWDVDGPNWGTPKSANLSSNDPSSSDYVAPTITPTPTPELIVNTDPPLESSASSIPSPTPTPSIEPEISPTPTPTPTPTQTLEEESTS